MRLRGLGRAGSVAVVGVSLLITAACSSSGSSGSSASSTPQATGSLPVVSGAAGQAATITLPSGKPVSSYQVKVVTQGSGKTVAKGDVALFNYTAEDWTTGKSLGSSYATSSTPQQAVVEPIGTGTLIKAWDQSLVGQKVGSRVMVIAPPDYAFGSQGNSTAGVGGSDVLVFVLDVGGTYTANVDTSGTEPATTGAGLPTVSGNPGSGEPTVKIPSSNPPSTLVTKTLIQGTGATVQKGQTLIAQYDGLIWKTGKVFDSSFSRKQVAGFTIGEGAVIPGWDTGLVGQKVGSRVLLVIPPADGYGSQGNSQAGIAATDTLVFVVDIVDAR